MTASALDDEDLRRLFVVDPDTLAGIKGSSPCDLLIVDEVHLLNEAQRDAVERIAREARHTLFLTATPSDMRRSYGAVASRASPLAWALRVVDPKASLATADGWDDWLDEGRGLATIADGVLAGNESPVRFWAEAQRLADAYRLEPPRSDDETISEAFRRLTPFERLVRTRRSVLPAQLLPQRVLGAHSIDYRAEELALLERINGRNQRGPLSRRAASSWRAVAKEMSGLDVEGKRLLRELGHMDSRVEALLDLLASIWREDKSRKVVIRAEYAATREHLAKVLGDLLNRGALRESTQEEIDAWSVEGSAGPIAVLEKGQDTLLELLASRDRSGLEGSMLHQLAAFEDSSVGGSPVLLAGDEAAVGLNLQGSATDLILFELPWRPLVVEQWIGRLDRLGRRPGRAVRLHVFRHEASPDAKLLAAYERLGLFSRSFGSSENDERIASAIDLAVEGSDWSPVLELAAEVAETETEEAASDSVLDLPLPEYLMADSGIAASEGFLDALRNAGFTVDRRESSTVSHISWPSPGRREQDSVCLREIRSALRRRSLGVPRLAVDPQRRWLRRSVDFLSPRHVLVRELLDDFSLDARVAAGAFRCPPSAELPKGAYILVLGRTHPAAGAQLALWETGALEVLGPGLVDKALADECATLSSGLERALTRAEPPVVLRGMWQVDLANGLLSRRWQTTEPGEDALNRGISTELPEKFEEWLALAEEALTREAWHLANNGEASNALDTRRALCAAASYVGCRARVLLERRQRDLDVTSASLPGIRASRQQSLERASDMFGRLGDLPAHAERARREALRVRGVAAYFLRVAS